MDLVAYLESKGCVVKNGGANNIYTHCWIHDEDPSKRGRLYINADEQSDMYGAYWCHVCSAKGGLNAIRKHFGDAPLDFDSTSSSPIMRAAVDYYSDRLFENVEAYTYLVEERGLSHEHIKKLRLGWADGGLLTYLIASGFSLEAVQEQGLINHFGHDFLRDRIVIPYMEYGEPYTIRGKKIGEKYLSLPGSTSHLYGVDNIRGEDTIHIAAGEFDCMVLNQLGFPAVGVPGEKMWKPEWTQAVSDAKRIFIILDPDETGKAGAEKLATILGPRCRVVELPIPEGHKTTDVSKMYVKGGATREDFEFLISKAKGGLLVSPAQAFDEWLIWEGNPDLQGLRFGLAPIDDEMAHGLLPGQVVTLLARTNVGKTIFSLNILHRMRMMKPDIKILFLSLEQMRNEWFERAHRIMNFYQPGATTLDTINYWKDNLFLVDENRITEDTLEMLIEQYKFETGHKPDIVLVDYLGYYARSFQGEEYARITSAIMGLKAIAKRHKLVFIAPHQANRSNDMGAEVRMDQGRGAGTVEETSDVALTMWNPDQRKPEHDALLTKADQKKELILKMPKARDSGVNTMCVLQSAPLTLAIVPKGDPLYDRALKERQYWINGMDWKDAVAMHIQDNGQVQLDSNNKWRPVGVE
jgi:archaellum biogenesis ATPase FlaH